MRKLLCSVLFIAAVSSISMMFLFACTSGEKQAGADKLSADDQKKLDEFRAELEIGRNMAGRLLQFYGTQTDQAALQYVNQVGTYIGGYTDAPERRYMFEILDTEMVNAFACPGGYVLLTLGALRHAKNEAELAAVIAHETAHVGKRHMFDKLKNMSDEELSKANDIANERLTLPETVQARKRPVAEKNEFGDTLAKYIAGGAAGLSIVKAAGAGMAVMLEQGLGADKEYEADGEGVKYAIRAGYAPAALVDYLCRLENKKGGNKGKCELGKTSKKKSSTVLDKTHPPVAQRISNIETVLDKMDAKRIVGASGEERFNRYKSKLPTAKKKA